ncbi:DUF1223 domain-containing protein [Pseudoxanthomonas dokdonensis]|nr:DUF1223 domain-containing protein [Pseudoxanthomonas dokdonensis]
MLAIQSLLAMSLISSNDALATQTCAARSGAQRVPLVELYTSEGCSSCPPADHWLSTQLPAQQANFLAFHVDYWDDIGWPDRFASPAYSNRQRQRVASAGGDTVYTPQVMVGAEVNGNWRSRSLWQATLAAEQRQAPGVALALQMTRTDDGWRVGIGATGLAADVPNARLWLARYVNGQLTQVRAGENQGRQLRHDRVVTGLLGPWPLSAGTLSQQAMLPASTGDDWGIVAFAQTADGQILQSLQLAASDCGPSS